MLTRNRRIQAATVIARNLVPVAGIIILGWSASNLLVTYFLDTLLAFAVLFALAGTQIIPYQPDPMMRPLGRFQYAVEIAMMAAAATSIVAIPLGMPLYIFVSIHSWPWKEALADFWFRIALGLQAGTALTGFARIFGELRRLPDAQRHLQRRFGFHFIRWFLVIAVAMTGLGMLPGFVGGFILVTTYAIATIYLELAPDRVMKMFGLRDEPATLSPPTPQKPRLRR